MIFFRFVNMWLYWIKIFIDTFPEITHKMHSPTYAYPSEGLYQSC